MKNHMKIKFSTTGKPGVQKFNKQTNMQTSDTCQYSVKTSCYSGPKELLQHSWFLQGKKP